MGHGCPKSALHPRLAVSGTGRCQRNSLVIGPEHEIVADRSKLNHTGF